MFTHTYYISSVPGDWRHGTSEPKCPCSWGFQSNCSLASLCTTTVHMPVSSVCLQTFCCPHDWVVSQIESTFEGIYWSRKSRKLVHERPFSGYEGNVTGFQNSTPNCNAKTIYRISNTMNCISTQWFVHKYLVWDTTVVCLLKIWWRSLICCIYITVQWNTFFTYSSFLK